VEGHLQKQDGVISVRAEIIQPAGKASLTVTSHDFH
jgi:hypothetical protein